MAPRSKQIDSSPSIHTATMIPQRSPIKRTVIITQRQKQALIDNLQLEITERARRLRAQYALQAHSLRSKLERRVSRVPPALRNKTMEELLLKHAAASNTEKKATRVQVAKKTAIRKDTTIAVPQVNPASPKLRATKRKSDAMYDMDKENTPDPSAAPMPKRQARDAAGTRTNPTMVLSPKTNNSRTLLQSPARPQLGSSGKALTHSNSPLKSTISPLKFAAAAATAGLANIVGGKSVVASIARSRTNSKTIKAAAKANNATQPRTVSAASNVSGSSGTSTGTIVRRVGAAIKSSVAPKKAVAAKTAAPKKTAVSKAKANVAKPEVAVVEKRTLRKRP